MMVVARQLYVNNLLWASARQFLVVSVCSKMIQAKHRKGNSKAKQSSKQVKWHKTTQIKKNKPSILSVHLGKTFGYMYHWPGYSTIACLFYFNIYFLQAIGPDKYYKHFRVPSGNKLCHIANDRKYFDSD